MLNTLYNLIYFTSSAKLIQCTCNSYITFYTVLYYVYMSAPWHSEFSCRMTYITSTVSVICYTVAGDLVCELPQDGAVVPKHVAVSWDSIKRKLEIKRRNIRSHSVKNWLRKRAWTRRNGEYGMKGFEIYEKVRDPWRSSTFNASVTARYINTTIHLLHHCLIRQPSTQPRSTGTNKQSEPQETNT